MLRSDTTLIIMLFARGVFVRLYCFYLLSSTRSAYWISLRGPCLPQDSDCLLKQLYAAVNFGLRLCLFVWICAMASRPTRILCINCNVCVNKLRRYPALELNTKVTSILCSWIYPEIITEDDVVCKTCLILARAAVNNASLRHDSGSSAQDAGPSRHIRADVCFVCGCSTAHKQKCKIIRENATEMQQSIYHIIESRVAPRVITPSDCVCIACWLRNKRDVERENRQDLARYNEPSQEQQPEDNISQSEIGNEPQEHRQFTRPTEIILPDYRRAANANKRCVFPNCHSTTFHGISDKLRAQILKQYKYYLPRLVRVCSEHLASNMWDTLYDSIHSIETFSADQIQHVFSFVNAYNPTIDFEDIENLDDRIIEYWLGYTKVQFNEFINGVPQLAALKRGTLGLAALLLKMRTGDSDEKISSLLQVPRRTLEMLMDRVRSVLTPQSSGLL